jgi:hypothetical protein
MEQPGSLETGAKSKTTTGRDAFAGASGSALKQEYPQVVDLRRTSSRADYAPSPSRVERLCLGKNL